MEKKVKRYQECSWLVKLWRRRFYLLIPFVALHGWIINQVYYSFNDEEPWNFIIWWNIATGLMQSKMHWFYTNEKSTKQ